MKLVHIFALSFVAAIWGFNFVAIKNAVTIIPPFTLGMIRFGLVSLPLLFFVPFPKTSFKNILAIGIFQGFIKFSLLFGGVEMGLSACLASLTLQTQAIFTTLLSGIVLKTPIHRYNLAGILIAFCGFFVLSLDMEYQSSFVGTSLIVLAAISWSISNIYYKKVGNVDMFGVVIWSSFIAFIPFIFVSLLLEPSSTYIRIFEKMDWTLGFTLLYISFISTWIGSTIWGRMVQIYNPAIVAPYTLLIVVSATLAGYLFLGETLTIVDVIACIIIIFGLIINQWPSFQVKKAVVL
jgi:O-acetylserine/cysteine efflux transporter